MTSTTETNPRCDMTASDAMFHYDLASLEPQEKIKLGQLLTADLPPAIASDANKKELLGHVMELYSFAAILKTTYDALPQVSEYTDAYECVRYTAEKLNTVAGEIEKFSW